MILLDELKFEQKVIELYKKETELMEVLESSKQFFARLYEKSYGISVDDLVKQKEQKAVQETEKQVKRESAEAF